MNNKNYWQKKDDENENVENIVEDKNGYNCYKKEDKSDYNCHKIEDKYYKVCYYKKSCRDEGTPKYHTCQSRGEQVENGGMELFTGDIPIGWETTTPNLVSQQTDQGRVHSGESSVSLQDNANLYQTIDYIKKGCFYEFSFFAKGEGGRVGFTAYVNFVTPKGNVLGATITVRKQDATNEDRDFSYYRVITSAAPEYVTEAVINFEVDAYVCQSLDLDDVSFSVN